VASPNGLWPHTIIIRLHIYRWIVCVVASGDRHRRRIIRRVFIHMMCSSTDHRKAQRRWASYHTNNALLAPPNGSTLRLYDIESIYYIGFALMTVRRLVSAQEGIIIITEKWSSTYVDGIGTESGLIPR